MMVTAVVPNKYPSPLPDNWHPFWVARFVGKMILVVLYGGGKFQNAKSLGQGGPDIPVEEQNWPIGNVSGHSGSRFNPFKVKPVPYIFLG